MCEFGKKEKKGKGGIFMDLKFYELKLFKAVSLFV